MDGSQQPLPGFSDRVSEQLLDAVRKVSDSQQDRDRGQYRRGRGQYHADTQLHHYAPTSNYQNAHYRSQNVNPQSWANQPVANPTDMSVFPPLGAIGSQAISSPQQQHQPHYAQTQPMLPPSNAPHPPNYPVPTTNQQPQHQRREPFPRGRGGPHRGRGNHSPRNNQYQPSPQGQFQQQNPGDFHRPPPAQRKLFTPGTHPHFNSIEDQRAIQRRIMDQSDFLNYLAHQSLKNQLTAEEQQAKESFRKELEVIAQQVITEARTEAMKFNPSHVQLKLYGSLGSGFGVAGSDMDLLLAFPRNEGPLGDIEIESRRMLERGLLDAGIGARLLTNTRVPILRVCQKPNPELLENLRECRLNWERSLINVELPPANEGHAPLPVLTKSQADAAAVALEGLDLDASQIPLPTSPPTEHAKLEFIGDCGIQCDINFTNYVALHNTLLLKTYGKCDSRVRQVGVFVKSWAKARDINTPYRGTLSSYGYILMVLHYLMTVVNPPLIPNLQEIAKHRDSFADQASSELVEGFDVRFVRDMEEVQAIMKDMPRNHESVGSLLRGFFQYYADPRGFHWQQEVISIRSRSGRVTKRSKGWTEAKWAESNQNVRLRYLLCIEDPFELEHNVGRTVGHSGIVAIREEFRRAWAIIDKIKFDNHDRVWFWLAQEDQRIDGINLMSVIDNRGDLLRKDQDFHRQKARQMRQELEAKEKALQMAMAQDDGSVVKTGLNGTFESRTHDLSHRSQMISAPSSATSVNGGNFQIKRHQQKVSNRRAIQDSDDENEERQEVQKIRTKEIDWSKPLGEAEISGDTIQLKEIDWDKPFDEAEISTDVVKGKEIDWDKPFVEAEISMDTVKQKEIDWDKPFDEAELSTVAVKDKDINWDKPSDEAETLTNVIKPKVIDWDKPFDEAELSINPKWKSSFTNENTSDEPGSLQPQTSELEVNDGWDRAGADSNYQVVKEEPQALMSEPVEVQSWRDQSPGIQHIHEELEQEPLEVIIGWDRQTQAGRWLRWRDKQICAGNPLKITNPKFQRLDREFPYDPNMTVTELVIKNKKLKTLHENKSRPEGQITQRQKMSDSVQSQSSEPKSASLGQETAYPVDTRVWFEMQIEERKRMDEVRPQVNNNSNSERLDQRSQSTNTRPSQNPKMYTTNSVSNAPVGNTEQSVSSQTPSFPARSRARKGSEAPGRPEHMETIRNPTKSEFPATFQSHISVSDQRSHANPLTTRTQTSTPQDQPLLVHERRPLVPLTLQPNVPDHQRSRDEDPKIIPIPRKLNFQFDPRQLADLEIIRRGGNGCARAGEEFEIEVDYEFGGGGVMATKSSTEAWSKGGKEDQSSKIGSKWEARGDEEGLLDELPRNIDI